MALTDEKIRSVLFKDVQTKTVLTTEDKLKELENKHAIEGWNMIKKENIGERIKVTFQKVK